MDDHQRRAATVAAAEDRPRHAVAGHRHRAGPPGEGGDRHGAVTRRAPRDTLAPHDTAALRGGRFLAGRGRNRPAGRPLPLIAARATLSPPDPSSASTQSKRRPVRPAPKPRERRPPLPRPPGRAINSIQLEKDRVYLPKPELRHAVGAVRRRHQDEGQGLLFRCPLCGARATISNASGTTKQGRLRADGSRPYLGDLE